MTEQKQGLSQEPSAEQIRSYFVKEGLRLRQAMKVHKKAGLWEKERDSEGRLKRTEQGRLSDWANVSEHCLVEAARVDVLSDLLMLSPDIKKDLVTAAALHDFFKKREREIAKAGGGTLSSYEEASRQSENILTEVGFSKQIVRLANSVGSTSSVMVETESLLNKNELT